MYFSAASCFRFPMSLVETLRTTLDDRLAETAKKPIGPQEMISQGFVKPLGEDGSLYVHQVMNYVGVSLCIEKRLLPASVLREALDEKIKKIEKAEDRSIKGKERTALKDATLQELIGKSFTTKERVNAYFDLATGTLVIDTTSKNKAEAVVSQIRRAMGSFPAVPLQINTSARQLMTSWIKGEALPTGLHLGEEAELHDPVEHGAVFKCSRQDLRSEEILHHITEGKQCVRIGLVSAQGLTFLLDENLCLRKIKFTDLTADQTAEVDHANNYAEEMDARFLVLTGLLEPLLKTIFTAFNVTSAEPLFDDHANTKKEADLPRRNKEKIEVIAINSHPIFAGGAHDRSERFSITIEQRR